MTRMLSTFGFVAILTACLGGTFHISAWIIAASAAALVLVALGHQQPHYGRFATQNNIAAQSILLAGSTLNAVTASTVAFFLGRAIAWLWGI